MISILIGSQGLLWTPCKLNLQSLERSWQRDWSLPLCWPWARILTLRVSWETPSQVVLAPQEVVRTSRYVKSLTLSKSVRLASEEAFLWEVPEETWERVSEETLHYCRIDLGLMEPEERSCSWSNSMTSDSTINPRSLRSACATTFSSVEKVIPNGVAIFCGTEKLRCVKVFNWLTIELQRIKIRLQKRKEWLNLPFV